MITFVGVLIICTLAAALWSVRWPLVGDAALIHYVVFLMTQGRMPYRDIVDINLPGSYFFEAIVMRSFGGGAFAWRLYDYLLLNLIGVAFLVIARRPRATAALIAALIFALLHMQDGVAQLGQRDLLIAVLLCFTYAARSYAPRARLRTVLLFVSFFALGITLTIKPVLLPLGCVLLCTSAWSAKRRGASPARELSLGLLGLATPACIAAVWLARHHALQAFYQINLTLLPLHAALGRRSYAFLLTHAAAPLIPVCVVWLLVFLLQRTPLTVERVELLAGVAVTLTAYVMQGKGFSYQRYPLLAMLLLVTHLDFSQALNGKRLLRAAAMAALVFECFFLAPKAAWQVRSFKNTTPMQTALANQLHGFGPSLSGHVQCLDTFGGCLNALYNNSLVQSTGFLYDCYLFTPSQNAASQIYRRDFIAAYRGTQPQVIVLTDQFCFGDHDFDKLKNWPAFEADLNLRYRPLSEWHSPELQRWWARSEQPTAFRLYVRCE